jgi:hypothetical protein
MNSINAKQELLMQSLTTFFTKPSNYTKILSVLNGESKVSLRVIDWFVTNYSKDVSYSRNPQSQPFMIYDNYKSQLKAYSKKQFDPFCRRTRIVFYFTATQKIDTTVGQLNFFRWAIENGVIDYIENNFASIENAMKSHTKVMKLSKKNSEYGSGSGSGSGSAPPLGTDMVGGGSNGSSSSSKNATHSGVTGTSGSNKSTKRNMSKLNFYVTIYFE